MFAIEVNGAGAFCGEDVDTELEEFHLDSGRVRLALGAFDRCDQMPHALFVHLRRRYLNAFVGNVIDATAKALLAEFFFDIDAGGLKVKGFALGAGGGCCHWCLKVEAVLVAGIRLIRFKGEESRREISSVNVPRPNSHRPQRRRPAALAASQRKSSSRPRQRGPVPTRPLALLAPIRRALA